MQAPLLEGLIFLGFQLVDGQSRPVRQCGLTSLDLPGFLGSTVSASHIHQLGA